MISSTADINSTVRRTDVGDFPAEGGDLPEQMGGVPRTTLLPGVDTFRLPANLSQLWHEFKATDDRQVLPNGQANPTQGQEKTYWQLKCDRNNPLVVVGGANDGEPMTATFSTKPRPRAKKDDWHKPSTAWVSDVQYLLFTCLGDKTAYATVEEYKAAINKHAGRTVRLEHGLSAQCRKDKVRYIRVALDAAGATQDMLDPSGKQGCGKRFYTKDLKADDAGQDDGAGGKIPPYDTEIACVCGDPTPEEAAAGAVPVQVVIRAFESVEKFLPALGS